MALSAGVATGFQFAPVTREALELALTRAAAAWREPKAWRRMQTNGMAMEVGWDRPAAQYAQLYRDLVSGRRDRLARKFAMAPDVAGRGRRRKMNDCSAN